jgi:hypothetical protein
MGCIVRKRRNTYQPPTKTEDRHGKGYIDLGKSNK